jgi:hypothetical protein
MARVPLRDVVLTDQFKGQARLQGTFYVYQPGTTTEATVYGAATGTTALTQPIRYNDYEQQQGFVPAGDYVLSCRSFTQNISATMGDEALAPTPSDDFLSVYNKPPVDTVPSVSATTTSQTIKLVRIVPDKKITAAQVVLYSGTAAA